MWVVGTIVVLLVGAAITTAIGWKPRETASAPLWDILKQGGALTGSVGTYAGFSLAVATFIAGLDDACTSPSFATVFGMLLVSFLTLVIAGWLGGLAPTVADAEAALPQSVAFVFGNLGSDLGVSIVWLTLTPLLSLVGLAALAPTFVWLSLIMVFGGSVWVAFVVYRLMQANVPSCLAMPVVGVGLPALYRLAAGRWPTLWPATDAALHFAFFALAIVGLMFAFQLGLLVVHGNSAISPRLHLGCGRMALGFSQADVMVVALIWLAVALP